MSKYRSKIDAEKNPSQGEINNEPSMTIEGEYQEMKDILRTAMQGGEIRRNDVQYFRPDDIQQINSLFRQSLDLTDIDALRQKNMTLADRINEAVERKKAELAKKQAEAEKQQEPETPVE